MRLEDKECDLRASMTSTDTKKLSVSKQEKAIMHEFEVHVKGAFCAFSFPLCPFVLRFLACRRLSPVSAPSFCFCERKIEPVLSTDSLVILPAFRTPRQSACDDELPEY
ncbi:hypothetical protein Q1695_012656 [Nippostrongylus brasiliensis]|nr:hypothetical protein Q1695_012656 [Nippostrongylus brasiliensis]